MAAPQALVVESLTATRLPSFPAAHSASDAKGAGLVRSPAAPATVRLLPLAAPILGVVMAQPVVMHSLPVPLWALVVSASPPRMAMLFLTNILLGRLLP